MHTAYATCITQQRMAQVVSVQKNCMPGVYQNEDGAVYDLYVQSEMLSLLLQAMDFVVHYIHAGLSSIPRQTGILDALGK